MQSKYLYSISLVSTVALLTACGGGSSSHTDPVSVTSSSALTTSSSSASSTIAYTEPTAALTLPASLEVVTNESNPPTGADSGTDYTNDSQSYHVWNESLKPIELVNSILCFTGQFKANEFVNAGPYLALADEKACFKDEGSSDASAQSAGAANVPTYMKVIVDATRGTDLTSPIVVKVWMPEMGGGGDGSQAIKFKAVIKKGATATNPFGDFTFNYEMFDSFTANNSQGGGEIKTVDIPNKIGFTLFESESGGGRDSSKNASVVMSTDRTEGIALTSSHESGGGDGDRGNAFGLAFNSNNVLLQTADSYTNLPFMPNDDNSGDESCLSRTTFDETVNRYDLYDSTTGARVELNSGLSFKYDSDANGDVDSFGHIGYWGVWTEKPNTLSNGSVIQAQTPGTQETTAYTVVQAPGRLIKNTVERLSLVDTKGIEFSYWSADAQQHGFQNWIVKYLTTTDGVETNGFYKTAGNSQGDQGPVTQPLDTPVAITESNNEALQMNSQQLGGNVKYKFGQSFLMFFKQEFVNGSETATDELFADGSSASLYCVERCPVGTLGATELQSWDTPYSPRASSLENVIAFNISNTGDNALALVRTSNSQIVKYNGVTEQGLTDAHSPYSWGIHSGSLITAKMLDKLANINDINNPDTVDVFYEWETGLNSFNQTTSIKNSQGVIQTFDKPIQIKYTHSDENDRSHDAGAFDGKVVMLNYGGNGELWGIPYVQSDNGRSLPQFNIADGVILGANNQYKIKAREIEGTMQDATGQCGALTLTPPDEAVPTTITGDAVIGDMPVVLTPPRVIGGVIQTAE